MVQSCSVFGTKACLSIYSNVVTLHLDTRRPSRTKCFHESLRPMEIDHFLMNSNWTFHSLRKDHPHLTCFGGSFRRRLGACLVRMPCAYASCICLVHMPCAYAMCIGKTRGDAFPTHPHIFESSRYGSLGELRSISSRSPSESVAYTAHLL